MKDEDIALHERYYKLTDHYHESCKYCSYYLNPNNRVKFVKLTDNGKLLVKNMCVDCAVINCGIYTGAQKLKLNINKKHLLDDCENSIKNGEYVKKLLETLKKNNK